MNQSETDLGITSMSAQVTIVRFGIRSGATEESKRQTYSVFFKDNDYVSSRLSAIVDHCEAQVFSALGK